ncbi:transcriptional regulator [Methylophilaceae bacterium 11]|uniref:CerR family C-terminal domain-containing protein n=1 Tax=Methylotenera sp. N17 TaxID=1502761 RepID=UPI0004491716|nr:CerR family C-terminal domain-containing protein [Methylotenera sp. N17]EUJ11235.1 transcriptional regulator [Methylophilaceae bacterium 11]
MSTPNPDIQPRENILLTALKLFSEQGYERTTVRQIAKTANVNVSAISYYFGDKNGLYKAAYTEPMGCPSDDIPLFDQQDMSLEQALTGLLSGFVEPMKQNELVRQCIRLHMREIIEPTGLWRNTIDNEITPHHQALLTVLKQHLGLDNADDDLHRLAFCIVSMGVHLFAGRDVIEKLCPQLIETEAALDIMLERMVMFAIGMIEAETARRKGRVCSNS